MPLSPKLQLRSGRHGSRHPHLSMPASEAGASPGFSPRPLPAPKHRHLRPPPPTHSRGQATTPPPPPSRPVNVFTFARKLLSTFTRLTTPRQLLVACGRLNVQCWRRPCPLMQSMKRWFCLVTVLWSLASFAEAEPPAVFPFPEHPPVNPKTFTPYVRKSMARVKIGGTRKDVTEASGRKGGRCFLPSRLTTMRNDAFLGDGGDTLFVDIVFRPATMSAAAFAKSRGQEEQLRRAGLWPVGDSRDVIQAISKPYRGPRPDREPAKTNPSSK